MWLVMRAPFLPIGSLAIWTRISWPSLSRSVIRGISAALLRRGACCRHHRLRERRPPRRPRPAIECRTLGALRVASGPGRSANFGAGVDSAVATASAASTASASAWASSSSASSSSSSSLRLPSRLQPRNRFSPQSASSPDVRSIELRVCMQRRLAGSGDLVAAWSPDSLRRRWVSSSIRRRQHLLRVLRRSGRGRLLPLRSPPLRPCLQRLRARGGVGMLGHGLQQPQSLRARLSSRLLSSLLPTTSSAEHGGHVHLVKALLFAVPCDPAERARAPTPGERLRRDARQPCCSCSGSVQTGRKQRLIVRKDLCDGAPDGCCRSGSRLACRVGSDGLVCASRDTWRSTLPAG